MAKIRKEQKFKQFSTIKVTNKMPSYMSHFEKGFVGIVAGTYHELYGGGDVDSYSLHILDKNGKIVNTISWYEENQISLIDDSLKTRKKNCLKVNKFDGDKE